MGATVTSYSLHRHLDLSYSAFTIGTLPQELDALTLLQYVFSRARWCGRHGSGITAARVHWHRFREQSWCSHGITFVMTGLTRGRTSELASS